MGIYPRSDFHHHPANTQDTPPPEVEGALGPQPAFRSSTETPREIRPPISPPMSSYDMSIKPNMSAGNSSEESQARHGGAKNPPPQQLPSLSSIFGPPSQIRPLHSPMSERPSPIYSPLDRPHSAAANPERHNSSSYFPTATTPAPPQRSVFESRHEKERVPLPSVGSQFPGPISPRPKEMEQPQNYAREESRWSSQSSLQDHRRPEYVFGTREPSTSSFRSVNDRYEYAPMSQKMSHDSMAGAREQDHMRPTAVSGYSPATSSTTVSEGAPVKDGLGPKIWTGTHFLPRFVRQAEVPGEGTCYFYDDGTHCKTVIDGEQVNAHWGVTKAGKPRKRLAIACLTCREKKIKCDPDYPRCVQCEKFGRTCRFKNAPRGGHNTSPVTSPSGQAESDPLSQADPEVHRAPPYLPAPQHSLTRLLSYLVCRPRGCVWTMTITVPRAETAHGSSSPPKFQKANLAWQRRDLPRIHEDLLCRTWQTNPYVSDPHATSTAITSFFNHIETTALRFLPAQLFKNWVKNNAHTKSPEDLTLLYSMLAFGVHMDGGPRHLAQQYAQVARFGCDRSAPGLQLIQTKLVLSLFYLANSRAFDSYEMLASAISIALLLRYNIELGQLPEELVPKSYPYTMNQTTFEECRTRTLFSLYILERINGLFPSRPTLLKTRDIFLRLPHDETLFDDNMGNVPETPMFDVSRDIPSSNSIGIMGYLVNIIEIWGRVLSGVQREALGAAPVEAEPRFIERISERLRQYADALPPKFRFTDPNLAEATEDGVGGALITLHLVHLLTRTKFTRHAQSEIARTLQAEAISQKCLSLAGDLMFATIALRDQLVKRRDTQVPYLATTFAVQAAIEAIDIMTAKGSMTSLPGSIQEITASKELCDAVSSKWANTKVQKEQLDERMEKLTLLHERGAAALDEEVPGCEVYRKPGTHDGNNVMYRMTEALETRFPASLDAIYGQRQTRA
ncbi:alcohol dehydrogenase [Apiospora arundinis]